MLAHHLNQTKTKYLNFNDDDGSLDNFSLASLNTYKLYQFYYIFIIYELAEFHNGLVSESRSWCWIAIDCCKAFGVNHSLWIDGINDLENK